MLSANFEAMKKIHYIIIVLAVAMVTASCHMSNQSVGSLIGAYGGSFVGAGLGAALGGNGASEYIGSTLGSITGEVVGSEIGYNQDKKQYEKQRHANQQQEQCEQQQQTAQGNSQTGNAPIQVIFPSGLLFDNGSTVLSESVRTSLSEFADTLRANPSMRIVIYGFSDNSVSESQSQQISYDRAKAVLGFFIGAGIDVNRMRIEGEGSNYPVADNAQEMGRAKNRRVEIFLQNPR